MKKSKRIHFGYLVVVALVLTSFIPLSLGLSCAGIFYPPLSAVLGVDPGILSYYVSILWISALASLPFTGRLFNNGNAKVALTGAVALVSVSFIWLSFTKALWQFFAAAVVMGIPVGMLLFLAPSTLINRWFVKRGGFMLGICMAFTGVGGMVWSTVGGILIDAIGWSSTYLVFAAMSAATIPATLFMVSSRPSDRNLMPCGAEAPDADGSAKKEGQGGVMAKDAFRMPVFYVLIAMSFVLNLAMSVYFMIPSYATTTDAGAAMPLLGATASSAAMAGQTLSKLLLGAIGEKHPYSSTMIALLVGIGGSLAFVVAGGLAALFYASAFFYGVYYGITNVMMPILTRISFGNRDYAKIYSRVSMATSVSNASGAFIWGTVIGITNSYAAMFVTAAVIMLLAAILLAVVARMQTRTEKALADAALS